MIPYDINNQVSMLWEKGVVAGQRLLYFILNRRVTAANLTTTAIIDDTTITATDPSWWQITSGLAAMEKAGLLSVGDLPQMQIQWYIGVKPQPMQLSEDRIISDRSLMAPETYLKLALSSQGEQYYNIDPAEFCMIFELDKLEFLSGLGSFQSVMGVSFNSIPVTLTTLGYLNLRSLTPDSILFPQTRKDFLQASPIWTFLALRFLKGNTAEQQINLPNLAIYGITEAKLNTDLIKFAEKNLLTLSFGNLLINWKFKPSPLPPAEIISSREKLFTNLGYLAQALSSDGRLTIPQAEFCDRWKITQADLTAGLTQLRSAGILDFSLGGASVTWLI
jgi:hypothetical protein